MIGVRMSHRRCGGCLTVQSFPKGCILGGVVALSLVLCSCMLDRATDNIVKHFSFQRAPFNSADVWPIGDQTHAWSWSVDKKTLQLIDTSGRIMSSLNVKALWPPRHDPWVPMVDPWILTMDGHLGTAHWDGAESRINLMLVDTLIP